MSIMEDPVRTLSREATTELFQMKIRIAQTHDLRVTMKKSRRNGLYVEWIETKNKIDGRAELTVASSLNDKTYEVKTIYYNDDLTLRERGTNV
mgnify:CR=1 FL=1